MGRHSCAEAVRGDERVILVIGRREWAVFIVCVCGEWVTVVGSEKVRMDPLYPEPAALVASIERALCLSHVPFSDEESHRVRGWSASQGLLHEVAGAAGAEPADDAADAAGADDAAHAAGADDAADAAAQVASARAAAFRLFETLRAEAEVAAERRVQASMERANGKRKQLCIGDTVRLSVVMLGPGGRLPAGRGGVDAPAALAATEDGCGFFPNAFFPCGAAARERVKKQAKNQTALRRWFSRALFRVREATAIPNRRRPAARCSAAQAAAGSLYKLTLVHDGTDAVVPAREHLGTYSREDLLWVDDRTMATAQRLGACVDAL